MAKGIFIAENMASTKLGSLLRSAKQDTAIENGCIVVLGDLVAGEKDLYESGAVATVATDRIYFVDGVELLADEQLTKGLDDFENPAKKPFRVRRPQLGDRFSISESVIDGTLGNNGYVKVKAGNKLEPAATSATTSLSFVAKVVDKWIFGTRAIPMVRLEVIHVL